MSTPKMTVDEILEGMYLLGYSHGNTDNKSLKQGVYKDIALAKQELKKLILFLCLAQIMKSIF